MLSLRDEIRSPRRGFDSETQKGSHLKIQELPSGKFSGNRAEEPKFGTGIRPIEIPALGIENRQDLQGIRPQCIMTNTIAGTEGAFREPERRRDRLSVFINDQIPRSGRRDLAPGVKRPCKGNNYVNPHNNGNRLLPGGSPKAH
jgi:hypothetical protein